MTTIKNIFHVVKQELTLPESNLKSRLAAIPSAQRLLSDPVKFEKRLEKAFIYTAMVDELGAAQAAFNKDNNEGGCAFSKQALSRETKDRIKTAVFAKLEESEFYRSDIRSSLKVQALGEGLSVLKSHWSYQLGKDLQGALNEQWQKDYHALLNDQIKRNIYLYLEDNPDVVYDVANRFIEVFKQAPEEKKRELLHLPLTASTVDLGHGLPIHFLMISGHLAGLKTIEPYLEERDWQASWTFKTNLLYTVIDGMRKNLTKHGWPAGCVRLLLKHYPKSKYVKSQLGFYAQSYIQDVINQLTRNSKIGGGRCHTFEDCRGGKYKEGRSDYTMAIEHLKQIQNAIWVPVHI